MSFDLHLIKAQDAFHKSLEVLDSIDITKEMELVMDRVKFAYEKGGLATGSDPMDFLKAEKLAMALEELGYNASAVSANMVINNERQAYVTLNWKHMPSNSRERLN